MKVDSSQYLCFLPLQAGGLGINALSSCSLVGIVAPVFVPELAWVLGMLVAESALTFGLGVVLVLAWGDAGLATFVPALEFVPAFRDWQG